MKSADTGFTDALAAARDGGIKPRRFVWFDLVDGTSLGFWTGDEDISTTLADGNGNSATRTYFGNGELKSVSEIVYVSDLSIQPVTVTMSRIAPNAQTLIYSHDPRLASVEIHDGLAASARALVSAPQLVWWGIVDKAPRTIPGAGQDSSVAISVVPAGIRLLTKTNPAKRSYASQKGRRGGDELYLYANAAASWQRYWGEAKSS